MSQTNLHHQLSWGCASVFGKAGSTPSFFSLPLVPFLALLRNKKYEESVSQGEDGKCTCPQKKSDFPQIKAQVRHSKLKSLLEDGKIFVYHHHKLQLGEEEPPFPRSIAVTSQTRHVGLPLSSTNSHDWECLCCVFLCCLLLYWKGNAMLWESWGGNTPPVPLADFSYCVWKEERFGQATTTLLVWGDPLVCFWWGCGFPNCPSFLHKHPASHALVPGPVTFPRKKDVGKVYCDLYTAHGKQTHWRGKRCMKHDECVVRTAD